MDEILAILAAQIGALSYVDKAYGRAYIFRENWGNGGIITMPKALISPNEYEQCLPHDINQAQTYFIPVSHEKFDQFDRVQIGGIHRQVALTFWGNIDTIAKSLDEIKFDCIEILQKSQYIASVDDYIDDEYKNVFPEFAYWLGRSAARGTEGIEMNTQYLMSPYGGFRLIFTVNYIQPC